MIGRRTSSDSRWRSAITRRTHLRLEIQFLWESHGPNGSILDHTLVSRPYIFGPAFERFSLDERRHGHILWILPITNAERRVTVHYGLDALDQRFDPAGALSIASAPPTRGRPPCRTGRDVAASSARIRPDR